MIYMGEEKDRVASQISDIIHSSFPEGIMMAFGFGSFWQNSSALKKTSDIDFMIIHDEMPNYYNVIYFSEELKKIKSNYTMSCQMMICTKQELFYGEENMFRMFGLYNHPEDPYVIIGSLPQPRIEPYINNLYYSTIANLVKTTRIFLKNILLYSEKMPLSFFERSLKEIDRLVKTLLYISNYENNPNDLFMSHIKNSELNEYKTQSIKTIEDLYNYYRIVNNVIRGFTK